MGAMAHLVVDWAFALLALLTSDMPMATQARYLGDKRETPLAICFASNSSSVKTHDQAVHSANFMVDTVVRYAMT